MTRIIGRNFAGELPLLEDGDELVRCDLSQERPHTKIGKGVRKLAFRWCSLLNCDIPDDAVAESCFCAHVTEAVEVRELAGNRREVTITRDVETSTGKTARAVTVEQQTLASREE